MDVSTLLTVKTFSFVFVGFLIVTTTTCNILLIFSSLGSLGCLGL